MSTNYCIYTVVPPDDGPKIRPKPVEVEKYAKNKLCIKAVLLCTIILRCTVNKTFKKWIYKKQRYTSKGIS
jgi:hypothetical protein